MKPSVVVCQSWRPPASSAWTARSSEPQYVVPSSPRAAAVQTELPAGNVQRSVPSGFTAYAQPPVLPA
jgi:hypothetical protein